MKSEQEILDKIKECKLTEQQARIIDDFLMGTVADTKIYILKWVLGK